MTDKTNYANCIDTRPHAAHPYRSIDRSLKECPGVKNTRYDAAYAQEYRDARRYPVIITME